MNEQIKAAASKASLALSALFLVLVAKESASFVSYEACHGSDHYARSFYCETVYRNEPGYRALPSNW